MAAASALDVFHPLIRRWFAESIGQPTEVQALSWPRIAAGEHVLITAPTGSGKTLTAFLWALQQLLTGAWPGGQVRVLYVSPLRALNTDIRRNLARPLAALEERFAAAGVELPAVRVVTRSGDTPASERRRMVRQPPEILITTPESLNILLTSQGGRALLGGLATVILDEIHAVAASKRGTHLITAVDRLVPLSGEFQRLALSATIKPLEAIADLIAGYELDEPLRPGAPGSAGGDGGYGYRKRRVTIIRASAAKRYELGVRFPVAAGTELEESHWDRLVRDFKQRIRRNRSTLVFANSRRVTEKVTRLINAGEAADLAYSHHGSLSREVRAVVERRLKEGELEAIVATSSLELGIDIGALDEVILVQTPRAISSTIQRLGRAGHGVGEVSRGRLYPTHGRDLLNAAIAVRSVLDQDIEAVCPIVAPLDVLAQVVLSMTAAETWGLDGLYATVRTSAPFHDLKRRQFDLVIDMLAGRYADSRIRELRPRISIDRIRNTVRARPGVARLLYMAGGTIPDRGYFALRLRESMAKIGELDEEFVWERSIGDTFTLGTQGWRIRKITHNDVLVAPTRGATAMAPFWRADVQDRDFHFSQKVGQFLARADRMLAEPGFVGELEDDYHLEPEAAAELVRFLKAQKSATGGRLPHRHHLLVEHVRDLGQDDDRRQVILHTFWGGRVNRPLAIALAAAWEERYPEPLEVLQDDDCILLLLPSAFAADDLLSLVDPEHLDQLLRHRLEKTGFFGARFRTNASTALLLPKSGFRHRMPLWLNRMRSKKLLAAVARYEDFPILVETWRTCLVDEFDLEHLKQLLRELRDGKIALSEVVTESASPFAAGLIWQQTNQTMYDDDTPDSARASNLRQDLLRELVFSSQLRPRLPPALIEQFCRKVRRTTPGYAPRDADELGEWLAERLLVPQEEWRELVAAVERDGGAQQGELLRDLEDRALAVTLPGASGVAICALDRLPRILQALALAPGDVVLGALADPRHPPPREARQGLETLWEKGSRAAEADSADEAPADPLAEMVGEWLRFYGPLAPERLRQVFGLAADRLREVLAVLQESQRVVIDQLTRSAGDSPGTELEICDVENLEILLRWLRRESRPSFQALGAEYLPLYLAVHQGLAKPGECPEDLRERLDKLLGYPLPAALWEAEILPARLSPYYPSWLDSLMQETDLVWFGCGKARLSFAFPADLELFQGHDDGEAAAGESAAALARIFPRSGAKFELSELSEHAGWSTAELTAELWRLAWEGRVANDSFVAVRKGIGNKFRPVSLPPPRDPRPRASRRRPGGRGAFDRWQATRPFFGSWFVLERETSPPDALEEEELIKDRLRVLLDRYGMVCRELVARELPLMQWSRLFRTLRLMELSGEILAGHFFEGVRGLQFISHSAYRELRRGLPEDGIYWMNAMDPASLCGIEIEGLKAELPARQASTHLVFHGPRLVLVSRRRGRELDFRVDAEHPHLPEYLEVLKVLLTREFQPLKFIDVETINGEPAPRSPYCAKLGEVFRTVREQRSVKLWKHY